MILHSLCASSLPFPPLCGDKSVKMLPSLTEISVSGISLIILENQEEEKKNKASKLFFCTFLSLRAIAQAK